MSRQTDFLSDVGWIGFGLKVVVQSGPSQKHDVLSISRQQFAQSVSIPLARGVNQTHGAAAFRVEVGLGRIGQCFAAIRAYDVVQFLSVIVVSV